MNGQVYAVCAVPSRPPVKPYVPRSHAVVETVKLPASHSGVK